jgi:type IV pilus assembly protein PilB
MENQNEVIMPEVGEIRKKLLEFNIVDRDVINEALEKSRQLKLPVYYYLMENKIINEDRLIDFLRDQYRLPYINIPNFNIDISLLQLVPETVAQKFKILPLFRIGNEITLATASPLDVLTRDYLQAITGCRIRQVLASLQEISNALNHVYITVDTSAECSDDDSNKTSAEKETYLQGLIQEAEQAPVVKMVSQILTQAVELKASDIHIEPYADRIDVRYRIDGSLRDFASPPLSLLSALVTRIKIISNLDIAEHRLPQSGRCEIDSREKTIDLRISIMPTIHGENIVIRVLDKSAVKLDLGSLGFDENFLERLRSVIQKPYGLILVTGPTGSGKSSTLYSILKTIYNPRKKVISIEDPVEYEFKGITQVAVKEDIGLTFSSVLRQVLRHDPDVIMVGEMRDSETAEIGIRSALTGHLVLSTLHTNDAPSAVTRLVDMGIPPFLAASTLLGAMAQRLMRKLCPYCKTQLKSYEKIIEEIGIRNKGDNEFKFYEPGSCNHCTGTGYSGRIAVGEMMIIDDNIRSLIAENTNSETIKRASVEAGMTTMRKNACKRFMEGVTSWEEVLALTALD